jgi:hypothetical protein
MLVRRNCNSFGKALVRKVPALNQQLPCPATDALKNVDHTFSNRFQPFLL